MAAGDFVTRRNASNTDTIPNSGTRDCLWDTAVASKGSSITYDGLTGEFELEAGKYLVIYSDQYGTTDTTNNHRLNVRSQLVLDGGLLLEGRTSGYIRKSSGSQEYINSAAAIIDVAAEGDKLLLRHTRVDDSTIGPPDRIAARSGIMILKLDDAWNYCRRYTTSTRSPSLSDDGAVTLDFDGNTETDAGAFAYTAGGTITLNTNNLVLCCYSVPIISSDASRSEYQFRVPKAGSVIPGSYDQTMARGSTDNCTNGGLNAAFLIDPTSGQSIIPKVVTRENGVSNVLAQGATIQLVELPASAKAVIVEATTGEWNLATGNFSWDTNPYIDTDSFTHTVGSASITVDNDGDFLVLASLAATAYEADTRAVPGLTIRNGNTDLPQAGASSYNRGINNAGFAAAFIGTISDGLSGGLETVVLRSNRLGTNVGTIDNGSGAMSVVELLSIFPDQDVSVGEIPAGTEVAEPQVDQTVDVPGISAGTATAEPTVDQTAEVGEIPAGTSSSEPRVDQTVDAAGVSAGSAVAEPQVDQTVELGEIATSTDVAAPTVQTGGDQQVAVGEITAGTSVAEPQVDQSVDVGAAASATAVEPPTQVDQTVDVDPATSSTVVAEPGVGQTVDIGGAAAASSVAEPQVDQTVPIGEIPAATDVAAPGVTQEGGDQQVAVGEIPAATGVAEPTVDQTVDVPAIAAGTAVAEPTVDQTVEVGGAAAAAATAEPAVAVSVDVLPIGTATDVAAPAQVDQMVDIGEIPAATDVASPGVTQEGGDQSVPVGEIATGTAVAEPSVDQTVDVQGASSAAGVAPPSRVDQTVDVGEVSTATDVAAPMADQQVPVGEIATGASTAEPQVDQTVDVGEIPTATDAGPVSVGSDQIVQVGEIATGTGVAAPSMAVTVEVLEIATGTSTSSPAVNLGVPVPGIPSVAAVAAPARIDQTVLVLPAAARARIRAPIPRFLDQRIIAGAVDVLVEPASADLLLEPAEADILIQEAALDLEVDNEPGTLDVDAPP